MIEVRIPKEIREYEDKIFMGMTVRQLVTTLMSMIISVFLFTNLKYIINIDILSYIIIGFDCLVLSIGWVEYNGMKMEKFIFVYFEMYFFSQKRYYQDCNIYEGLNAELKKEMKKDIMINQKKERVRFAKKKK